MLHSDKGVLSRSILLDFLGDVKGTRLSAKSSDCRVDLRDLNLLTASKPVIFPQPLLALTIYCRLSSSDEDDELALEGKGVLHAKFTAEVT